MPFNKFSLLALINHSLYFANPNSLNDPIDCTHNIKIKNLSKLTVTDIISLISKNRSILTWNKKLTDDQISKDCLADTQLLITLLIHLIREIGKKKIGICSFSTIYDDQRLWSHYADSSKGMCIVFDKNLLVSKIELNTNRLDPHLRKYYGGSVNYSGLPYELEIYNNDFEIKYNYYLNKTEAWSYEKEYRLILLAEAGMNDYSSYEKTRYLKLPKEAIAGIILGEKTTNYELNTLQVLCPKLGYKITINRASRDIKTGKLKIPIKPDF